MALRLSSFNLHGFNQGFDMLKSLASVHDIIFVQEHWLVPSDFVKLHDLFDKLDMLCIASSPMGNIVSKGILRGRPFGGLCIAMKKGFCTSMKCIVASENFIIVQICDCILINIYLPCVSNSHSDWKEKFTCILDRIELELSNVSYKHIIIGGDWNFDFHTARHPMASIISEFLINLDLTVMPKENNVNPSTFISTSGACSNIDHFAVLNGDVVDCSNVKIIESGENLSDHNPISMLFNNYNFNVTQNVVSNKLMNKNTKYAPVYRWDKSNLNSYYEETFKLLNRITVPFQLLLKNDGENTSLLLNNYYNAIIDALTKASKKHVKLKMKSFYKHWWSQELSDLKTESIHKFEIWKNAGKPKYGPLFIDMNQAKLCYKRAINQHKDKSKKSISDKLSNHLASKNGKDFWTSWKSKMGGSSITTTVDGLHEHEQIANHFADSFAVINNHNNVNKNVEWCNKFMLLYNSYNINNVNKTNNINVETVLACIKQLSNGKAAGMDGLVAEHLKFAHPLLGVLLSFLFRMILINGLVPSSFCESIIVPLIKDESISKSDSSNYRGIALSPCISKVFEIALLQLIKPLLSSSFNQFGFKAGTGCRNAITWFKATVNYFNSNNSTVNVCALDISKAFDKVNHYALLCKLISCKVDKFIIGILLNWLSRCCASVRWQNVLSYNFPLLAGVRQGGLLSPLLFNLYIDELYSRLKDSGLGCHLYGLYSGCLLYADDILLLSHSCTALQRMLNICSVFADDYDVKFNVKKCAFVRIGPGLHRKINDVLLSGEI